MPKNVREGPLGAFEHPFFCKIEKIEGVTPWRHLKNLRKKVSQTRKKPGQKFFSQGRDSNPRSSAGQTSKKP